VDNPAAGTRPAKPRPAVSPRTGTDLPAGVVRPRRQRRIVRTTRITATATTSRISGTISHSHRQFLLLLELVVPDVVLCPAVVVTALLLPPEVLLTPPLLLTVPLLTVPPLLLLPLLPPEVLLTPPLLLTVPPLLPPLEPEPELEPRPPLLELDELELSPPLLELLELLELDELEPPLLLPLEPPETRPGAACVRLPSSGPGPAVRPDSAERDACTDLTSSAPGTAPDAAYAVPPVPASRAHSSSADVPTRMLPPVVVFQRHSMTGTHAREQAQAAGADPPAV
jgi:hypothetical protein